MSLDWWFSNGCLKDIYSKFYAFILKKLVILYIYMFFIVFKHIERHFNIIFLLCMYGLLASFCSNLINYGLCDSG